MRSRGYSISAVHQLPKSVEFPDLPGCVTEGGDLEEAMEMGTDAAGGWILRELEDGEKIPGASDYSEMAIEDGRMVNILLLDIDSYEEKYGEKAVGKNLTVSAWLTAFAEKIMSTSPNSCKMLCFRWRRENKEVKRNEKEKMRNEGIAAQFRTGANVSASLLYAGERLKRIEEQRNAPQLSPWGIPFSCLGSRDPKRICSVSSRFPSYA